MTRDKHQPVDRRDENQRPSPLFRWGLTLIVLFVLGVAVLLFDKMLNWLLGGG